jgi:hypothetical protein
MNEQLQKLYEQSFVTDSYVNVGPDGAKLGIKFDPEKFAELIVGECIGCCEQVISDPIPKSVDTFEQGGIHCIDEIKQHFGVEE